MGYTRESKEDKETGKRKGNILSNFDDYNLERPQIILQDINNSRFRKLFI